MKTFTFVYRDEFVIVVEAINESEAENIARGNFGDGKIVKIEIIGELWPEYIQLDEEN